MNIFEKILIFLDSNMVEPTNYGWFHILCLLLLVLVIYLTKKIKNDRKLIFIISILCIGLEIYKQINFSFNYDTVNTWWRYKWYAFPFQFCSTPMYIGLIASVIKSDKIRNYLYSFLATYGLIAGIAVMLYPNQVFTSTIGINIQTMICHGSMVLMGLYLLINKKVEFNYKTVLKALLVFSIQVLIALSADILTYYINLDGGLELFYLSPYHKSILPVFSLIYEKVPYIVFLFIYIVGFSIGNIMIIFFSYLINKCLICISKKDVIQ